MEKNNKQKLSKAGHYEIHGETIAKFEFFDNGYNPYSRYLDVDKVDLILRRRLENKIEYIEVQVKYGRLYECGEKWAKGLFDFTSWRFFKPDEFKNVHSSLYIAYVMSHPEGYRGDIFIFPAKTFNGLIKEGIERNTKKGKQYIMYIAHSVQDNHWYLWKKRGVKKIDDSNTVDVTAYRRNFDFH